ncbi:MAG TPA: vWA domain-containing protein [Polyangiaceae bacterium]|jgi:hypothetical protein|nr:vWA domain-containing protein [Polyangiaceae bacterium]
MRGTRTASELFALGLLFAVAAGCSASTDGSSAAGTGARDGGVGGATAAGGAASVGQGGTVSSAGVTGTGAIFAGVGNTKSSDAGSCAQVVSKGEIVPLDMYILLDKSSSMLDVTGAGPTKWDAIRAALESFVNDSASAGLSVGLQYFPILKPGVPATCTTNAECGAGGPCFLASCDNTGVITPCATAADCTRGGRCVPFGVCERYPVGGSPEFCSPVGGTCTGGLGGCIDVPDRWCVNGIECTQDKYAAPAVGIAVLPGNAAPLMSSIDATTPEGRTPTAPALQGAITEASTWGKAHQGHRVVAVLATDGLPTECTPTDINGVAALASSGVGATPSISTFVIGVFGPDDTDSQTNLDTIAKSGGTTKAFIVDTSGDVTKEFQAALNAIRGSALVSCDFQVPPSTGSAGLDYGKVNLEVTKSTGDKEQLVYVDSDAACASATTPAWHYDVAPTTATPQRIIVCPSACTAITSDPGAQVNLQIGCKDSIR